MELRRNTMSNPSGVFSSIAQEALDHLVVDGEYDDRISRDTPHLITYQPTRRRPKVSRNLLFFLCTDTIRSNR